MSNKTGLVLKAENVRIAGKFHLDLNQPDTPPPSGGAAVSCVPQARIVQNNDEFAVVELTCGCGNKSLIRCEYTKPN